MIPSTSITSLIYVFFHFYLAAKPLIPPKVVVRETETDHRVFLQNRRRHLCSPLCTFILVVHARKDVTTRHLYSAVVREVEKWLPQASCHREIPSPP
ncbi:hypothetical protein SESBI_13343 [Sesbania bispinosa]|nr:hypothetical protein SESBI_13343 [Sesbania bispinosa]